MSNKQILFIFLLKCIPFRNQLMQRAARSYSIKNNTTLNKVLCKAYSFLPPNVAMETNFGISPELKLMKIEPWNKIQPVYLYGTPMQFEEERGALYLSLALMETKKVYLDVGSHYGYFSLFMRTHLPKEKVIHYFEPNTNLFSFIDNAVKINDFKNIYGHREAVSTQSGETKFYVNHTYPYLSSFQNDFPKGCEVEEVDVKIISLDDFIEKKDINIKECVIKIDVEQAEYIVEKGATELFKKLDYLIMEVLRSAINDKFIFYMSNTYDFHVYNINDFELVYCPKNENEKYSDVSRYNWLFTTKSPNELKEILKGSKFTFKG